MTPREAAQCLATMQAAWHGKVAEDDAATELWMSRLRKTEPVPARAAVEQLIELSEFPPTIAAFVSALRDVMRYPLPGETRKELGYSSPAPKDTGGMHPSVAKRVNDEFKTAQADREHRRRSLSGEDFIRSEGHDPATHRLSKSGFVLRKVDPKTKLRSGLGGETENP